MTLGVTTACAGPPSVVSDRAGRRGTILQRVEQEVAHLREFVHNGPLDFVETPDHVSELCSLANPFGRVGRLRAEGVAHHDPNHAPRPQDQMSLQATMPRSWKPSMAASS